MRRLTILLITLLPLAAHAEVKHFYDFEQSTDLKDYPALTFSKDVRAEIVPEGAGGRGNCLKITNPAPGKYCQVSVKLGFPMQRNLAVSFDHREVIQEGARANYLGVIFNGPQDSQWYGSDKFSDQWRHVELAPGEMHSPTGTTLTLETLLTHVNIYGRAHDDTPAVMTVWVDNIRVHDEPRAGQMSDKSRVSYTAAPFFHWVKGLGKVRLEYSQDPAFPTPATTTVETTRNWYLPDKLLTPGDWYWRIYRDSPLASSYTATEKLVIPAEAHRYLGKPIDFTSLARRPYPRFMTLPLVTDEKQKQALISRAKSLYQQGVPDDPPAYAPGNPEWPTWIDWYGKVHGGITSRTGGRLQQMAELYVQTRDPQVRDWLKEMALKAATWDPLGGSSLKGGDIGFQHLLRGLNWSYDALHDDLSDTEREALRGMLIRRAELFNGYLNPFRFGREFNNHAWLCALALGESGLLLTGEHEPAADWAQYAYDLYCGLFLCSLGYQGDNNEGIGYWGYGLQFVIKYAEMMKHVCDLDLFQHPWLYQTARFPMYTCPPGAWAVSFADTAKPNHGIFGPSMASYVKDLALRTKDPYALWYGGGTAEEAGFAPKPPLDLPQSIHYRFIGWGLFNASLLNGAEGVTVAMHSGPFWAGHQHEDQNGFVINAYGEKPVIDSGYYDWYGSPHFKGWSTLTRAHNAILVNGLDQDSRKMGCDGVMKTWFDSPAYGYMVGDASDPDMYQGALKQWDRRLLFIKPGLVIIHDLLEASQGPAQYDWLLHAVAPIETDEPRRTFNLTTGKVTLNGTVVTPGDIGFKVVKGYPVEPVDGYSTRPVPPDKYAHEWTLWATPKEKRQAEDILAVLQVRREGDDRAPVEELAVENGLGCAFNTGKETSAVLFRGRGGSPKVSTSGVSASAEVAAITCDMAGKPLSAMCINATALQGAGISMQADHPVDLAWVDNELGEMINVRATELSKIIVMLNLRGEPDLSKARGVKIRPVKGLWELSVPPGEHQIIWPATSSKPPLNGGIKLTHYPLPVGAKATHYWWGTADAPAMGQYRLQIADPVRLTSLALDSRPVELSGQRTVWLKPGSHTLLLSGPAIAPQVRLTRLPGDIAVATMLPNDYRPAAGAITIEAEKPLVEGRVKGLIVEKVGASGKLAHCTWDTDGQWASWRATVPGGRYRLLIRGCSEQPEVLRLLQLDSEQSGPTHTLRLSGTGGWARTTDDWRYFAVPGTMDLGPGDHTIRLERLDGSMNLDCFILEPQ